MDGRNFGEALGNAFVFLLVVAVLGILSIAAWIVYLGGKLFGWW